MVIKSTASAEISDKENIHIGSEGFPEAHFLHEQYPYTKDVICDFRLAGFPAAWYPFMSKVSPQRLAMSGKHIPQSIVLNKPEHPHIYSGLETDHASYATNSSRREEDIEVLDAIPKYRPYPDMLGPKETPSWLIIYRGLDTREINCITIDRYVSCAEGWGYRNDWNEHAIRKYLRPGEVIMKDTVLSSPPTVAGPRHRQGVNANVVYLPISEVDQDAMVVSDYLAEKLATYGLVERPLIIPPNYMPLPIYAEPGYPDKWHPDVGEYIRDDGTVCVFRKMNTDRFAADASEEALSRFDPNLDIILKGPPGAKVADIDFLVNRQHLEEMPPQVKTYVDNNKEYYTRIIEAYRKYPTAAISDHFSKVVVEAACRLIGMGEPVFGVVPKDSMALEGIRSNPVEYIHVKFSFYHKIPVKSGSKLSDRAG